MKNKKENALKLDEEHKNSIKKTKEMGIVIKRIEKGKRKKTLEGRVKKGETKKIVDERKWEGKVPSWRLKV